MKSLLIPGDKTRDNYGKDHDWVKSSGKHVREMYTPLNPTFI